MTKVENEKLFNLQCWALTCETFLSPDEWVWILKNLNTAVIMSLFF